MKTSERFDRAIKALVKGYMNDTLVRRFCTACAVGNIIAECHRYDIKEDEDMEGCLSWFNTSGIEVHSQWWWALSEGVIYPSKYTGKVKVEIDSTGYSIENLAKVEKAFELVGDEMFDGLMAVVDVLCEIEGINDPSPYKEMFEGKELPLAQGIGND